MGNPEHISGLIQVVLEAIYDGHNWDAAIEAELKWRGLTIDQVRTIICVPKAMAGGKDRHKSLFTDGVRSHSNDD